LVEQNGAFQRGGIIDASEFLELKTPKPHVNKSTVTLMCGLDPGGLSSLFWVALTARFDIPLRPDLYLEGSDQHRGWFMSSLITRFAAKGCRALQAGLNSWFYQ